MTFEVRLLFTSYCSTQNKMFHDRNDSLPIYKVMRETWISEENGGRDIGIYRLLRSLFLERIFFFFWIYRDYRCRQKVLGRAFEARRGLGLPETILFFFSLFRRDEMGRLNECM